MFQSDDLAACNAHIAAELARCDEADAFLIRSGHQLKPDQLTETPQPLLKLLASVYVFFGVVFNVLLLYLLFENLNSLIKVTRINSQSL
jgi:hypothetical protein